MHLLVLRRLDFRFVAIRAMADETSTKQPGMLKSFLCGGVGGICLVRVVCGTSINCFVSLLGIRKKCYTRRCKRAVYWFGKLLGVATHCGIVRTQTIGPSTPVCDGMHTWAFIHGRYMHARHFN